MAEDQGESGARIPPPKMLAPSVLIRLVPTDAVCGVDNVFRNPRASSIHYCLVLLIIFFPFHATLKLPPRSRLGWATGLISGRIESMIRSITRQLNELSSLLL